MNSLIYFFIGMVSFGIVGVLQRFVKDRTLLSFLAWVVGFVIGVTVSMLIMFY